MSRLLLVALLIFSLNFVYYPFAFAQDKGHVGNLQQKLEDLKGEDRVKILLELSSYFVRSEPERSLACSGEVIEIGKALNNPSILSRGLVERSVYFRMKGEYDSALFLLKKAEKTCEYISDHSLQGILNLRFGRLYEDMKKFDSAFVYTDRALSDYKAANDRFHYAMALSQKGGTHYGVGEMKASKACLDESTVILEEILKSDSSYLVVRETAVAISQLGNYYLLTGNYEEALSANLKSLRFFERTQDIRAQGIAMHTVGTTYRRLRKPSLAMMYFRNAISKYTVIGEESSIGAAMESIGLSFTDVVERDSSQMNCKDSALTYFNNALNIAVKQNNVPRQANIFNNMGGLYFIIKDNKKAAEYYQRSFDLRGGLKNANKRNVSAGLINLGNTYLRTGNLKRAGEYLALGFRYAKEISSKDHQKSALEGLVEYYTAINDHKRANEYLNILLPLKDSLYATESQSRIAEMQVKYESEKKEQEINLLKTESRYAKLKQIGLVAGIVLSVLIAGLLYRVQQTKKARILAELSVVREREKAAEEQVEFKNREIVNFAVQITEKNDFLEAVGKEIEEMSGEKEQTSQKLEKIVTLLKNHTNVSVNRKEFEAHVANVYDSFIKRLEEKFPELTDHEKRLATLLRINLTSKEIASVFNISSKSVDMNRYRLRKKMGLEGEQSLNDILNSI